MAFVKPDKSGLLTALPVRDMTSPISSSEPGWTVLPRRVSDTIAAAKNVHELGAAMRRRIAGVLSNPLTFQAPEGDTRAEKARDMVEEYFKNIPKLNRFLALLLGGQAHGISTVELIWERDGANMRLAGMDEFDVRYLGRTPERNFIYRDWATDFPEQPVQGGTMIDPFKIAHFSTSSRKLRGDNYIEEAYIAARGLFLTGRFWLMTAERFGSPTLIGQRKGIVGGGGAFETTEDKEDEVWKVLTSIRANATVSLPEGVEVSLLEADLRGVSSGLFKELGDYWETAIRKVVLGADLSMDSGERGARALGEVQQDGTQQILKADAQDLEEIIQNQMVNRLLILNGYEPDIVQTNYDIAESDDLMQKVEYVKAIQDLGLDQSSAYVRDFLGGVPEPLDEADTLPGRTGGSAPAFGFPDDLKFGEEFGKRAGEAFYQLALFGPEKLNGSG